MKQIQKYLLGLTLFTGVLWALISFASEFQHPESFEIPVTQTGNLCEEGPDLLLGMPDNLLLPASNAHGFALRANRIQPAAPRLAFTPVEGFIDRHTARDYNTNYALIEVNQKDLLPYLDHTLEYIFLLRRILI